MVTAEQWSNNEDDPHREQPAAPTLKFNRSLKARATKQTKTFGATVPAETLKHEGEFQKLQLFTWNLTTAKTEL